MILSDSVSFFSRENEPSDADFVETIWHIEHLLFVRGWIPQFVGNM
jgi:hypothetical protein